jgi:hypothetical protein
MQPAPAGAPLCALDLHDLSSADDQPSRGLHGSRQQSLCQLLRTQKQVKRGNTAEELSPFFCVTGHTLWEEALRKGRA